MRVHGVLRTASKGSRKPSLFKSRDAPLLWTVIYNTRTMNRLWPAYVFIALLTNSSPAQQVTGQDLDTILERADKILEEAKADYDQAKSKDSVQGFVEAGFKLEEARIKYIVLQEIGSPEKQKIATDRIRAVNQLSKLIHDGKVAISGSAVESPAAKPPESAKPDPSAPAPEKPPAPSEKPEPSPLTRAPIPPMPKQQEAEKLVKDLFQEQYAKKTPADRQALAKLLLEQAAKTSNDLGALWVLYREAMDAAVQACDVNFISAAIEGTSRVFDVDAHSLTLNALTGAGKTAKTPAEFATLSESLLKLVDDLISTDMYDAAEKSMNLANQYVHRTSDAGLTLRVVTRSREVTEAKTRYQTMKSVLQTLAKNPEDPASNNEVGQFLCFVKGSWDLGLRFIVKGSDQSLKELARKELELKTEPVDQVSIADSWAGLAEKERSPLRKSQLVSHSRALYQRALGSADGLLKAKIEKRLSEVGTGGKRPPVDLLKMIDPEKDSVKGKWKLVAGALLSPTPELGQGTILQVPYEPPEEYDLTVVLERKAGTNYLAIAMPCGKTRFAVVMDAWPQEGGIYGLEKVDGQAVKSNETGKKGILAPLNKPITVVCMIRRGSITITVEGKTIVDWKNTFDRLSLPRSEGPLFFEAWDSSMRVSKISLVPFGTDGKRLR